jgi:hypothetical protein
MDACEGTYVSSGMSSGREFDHRVLYDKILTGASFATL